MVLEELNHALERGVPTIYGEILGYGMSCDAHHLTAPSSDGSGAVNCMRAALEDAGVAPQQVAASTSHTVSTTHMHLHYKTTETSPSPPHSAFHAPLLQDHTSTQIPPPTSP